MTVDGFPLGSDSAEHQLAKEVHQSLLQIKLENANHDRVMRNHQRRFHAWLKLTYPTLPQIAEMEAETPWLLDPEEPLLSTIPATADPGKSEKS